MPLRQKEDFLIMSECMRRLFNSKKEQCMIEVSFKKDSSGSDSRRSSRNIDNNVVREYLFNSLKINLSEITYVDINTRRYNTKHILFKLGVLIDKYVSEFPETFSDYIVNIARMTQNEQKVTFKSMPSYVPNKEILNL